MIYLAHFLSTPKHASVLVATVFLAAILPGPAATIIWDGDANGNWKVRTNWVGNTAPKSFIEVGSGDTLNLTGSIKGTGNNLNNTLIRKDGLGTLIIASDNSLKPGKEAFRVSEGTLQFGNGGSTGSLGDSRNQIEIDVGGKVVYNTSSNKDANKLIGGGSLVQMGTGVLTLAVANSYTGSTSVNNGTLVIDGSTHSSSAVTVATAGTLSGSGTVGGPTSISGTHAPGTGTGVQSFSGDLGYNSGSIFEWELDTAATNPETARGSAYDAVNVDGTLSGSDAVFGVLLQGSQDFSDSFWNSPRVWTDIFTDGSLNVLGYDTIFSSFSYSNAFGTISPIGQGSFTINSSNLSWSPVPEPSTALALALLLSGGTMLRRRNTVAFSDGF